MPEYTKKDLLKRADKWVNKVFACEKCQDMTWYPIDVGYQSTNRDLFFFVMLCNSCNHQQDSDPIRLEKFLKLTEK